MTTIQPPSFGVLLKRYRLAAGLTQESLAERAGVSERLIRAYESGSRQRPHKDTLEQLTAALGLSEAEKFTLATAAVQARSFSSVQQVSTRHLAILPVPLTPLLGRDGDVATICGLLQQPSVRVLTLLGPGGVGKTRLGLQVAQNLREAFADGVVFISLVSTRDPRQVLSIIAQALDIKETGDRPLLQTLHRVLQRSNQLLVLDNVEHVLDAAPAIVDLLTACPDMKVLATSRAPLHVRGEQEFSVAPLTLPDMAHLPTLAQLSENPAVALFLQRAQAVQRDFSLMHETAAVVAAICQRLDGLPLAIELAAARIKSLSAPDLLARLDQRLPLLTGGPRDLPVHQRTLEGTIRWSYELLSPPVQVFFRQVSVFIGGWTLDAAEAVCSVDHDNGYLLDQLTSLVTNSLVQHHVRADGGEDRYSMLETIREFAAARLTEHGEEQTMRARHVAYYLAIAEQAYDHSYVGRKAEMVAHLAPDFANMRAAVAWSLGAQQDVVGGARLAAVLWRFCEIRGHLREAREWLHEALAHSDALPSEVRAKALNAVGQVALTQGDFPAALSFLEQAYALCAELNDRSGIAQALYKMGIIAQFHGDSARAVDLNTRSMALHQEVGDHHGAAHAQTDLAFALFFSPDPRPAAELLQRSLAFYREVGDAESIGVCLFGLGVLHFLGRDLAGADACAREGLRTFATLPHMAGIANCLDGLAAVAAKGGQEQQAAWLFGAVAALRESIHVPRPPVYERIYQEIIASVQHALGEQFTSAWDSGHTASLEEVLATTLAASASPLERRPRTAR